MAPALDAPSAYLLPSALVLAPVVLSLVLRSLLVAGEAGVSGVGLERARDLSEESRSGKALLRLKFHPERTAAGIRAALALTLAAAAALFAAYAVGLARDHAPALPAWAAAFLGGAVVWVLTVVLDVIPRSLAAANPEPWALRCAPLLLFARGLLSPVTRLVGAGVDLLLRPFGAKVRFGLPPPPLEEIEHLLTQSTSAGAPEPALVRSLFEFGDRTVKEIMVPRTDVVAIPHDAPTDEILRILVEEGHTRVPVYRSTLDTIIGIIHVKDVLPLLANPELIILHDLIRPPMFVPWSLPIQKVMRELQRKRQHFAVVVDEYGGVAGIVTLEDIVEQIVGDIRDEFDEEEPDVTAGADGTLLVKGEMRVAQFNERFHAEVPEEEGYETMGGFLSALAGAIPSEGDRFYYGGLEFQVARRDPRRVLEVKVTRTRAGGEVGAGATRQ